MLTIKIMKKMNCIFKVLKGANTPRNYQNNLVDLHNMLCFLTETHWWIFLCGKLSGVYENKGPLTLGRWHTLVENAFLNTLGWLVSSYIFRGGQCCIILVFLHVPVYKSVGDFSLWFRVPCTVCLSIHKFTHKFSITQNLSKIIFLNY